MMMMTTLGVMTVVAMTLLLRLVCNRHTQGQCASLNLIGFIMFFAKAWGLRLPVLRDGGLRPGRDKGSGGFQLRDPLTFRFIGFSPDARSTVWCRTTQYKVSKIHGSSCSSSNSGCSGCHRCRHIPSRRWTPPGPFLPEHRSWMTAGTR